MQALDALELPLTGRHLIEASAGTGKTYTITTLILRLLLERHLRIDQILVVTFTKAATAELRGRVRGRIQEAARAFETGTEDAEIARLLSGSSDREADRLRLRQALHGFDEAAIFTIHGFCQRALLDHAFESQARFETELVSDQTPLLLQVVEDYWSRELSQVTPARAAFLRSQKVDLGALVSLAHVAVGWPDVPLETGGAAADADAAIERYVAARGRVRELWRGSREQIEALLRDDPALSRNKFRAASVAEWCSELDELLAREEPSLGGWFARADRFATRTIVAATKKGHQPPRHPLFDAADELCAAHEAAESSLSAWLAAFQVGLVRYVRQELSRRKVDAGVQSFDDLLTQLVTALRGAGGSALADGIRQRYPAALIDEFQDTDAVQYEIFSTVWSQPDTTLLLIGDPKQAIYAFRGADVFSYLAAAREAGSERYGLSTNYRSDPGLVRAINTVFSRPEQPFEVEGIDYHPVAARPGAEDAFQVSGRSRAPFEIAFVEREAGSAQINKTRTDLALRVASDIVELLHAEPSVGDKPLHPGMIAVLTRTNKEAQEVQVALAERQVPSVLLGDRSVLESEEAGELAFILAALARPNDEGALTAALVTAPFGVDAGELLRLKEDEAAWERHVERFHRWHARWESDGFMRAFRGMLAESGATSRLLALSDGERRLTNFLHLGELVHQAAKEHHLGIAGVLRFYDEVRFDSAKRDSMAPDAQQIRLERDDAAVKLTTMHKSKGLEYEVVYCPYLWDGTVLRGSDEKVLRYHDPNRGGQLVLRLGEGNQDANRRVGCSRGSRGEPAPRLRGADASQAPHRRGLGGVQRRRELSSRSPAPVRASSGRDRAAPAQLLQHLDDRQLRAEGERLVAASAKPLVSGILRRATERTLAAPVAQSRSLAARGIERRFGAEHRSSSFSALVAGSHARYSVFAALGRDVDEGTAADASRPSAARKPVPLHSFPRGARPGELLHAIFEHADFSDPTELGSWCGPPWRPTATTPTLTEHLGPGDRGHPGDAARGERLVLADVGPGSRLNELEFAFPVAGPGPYSLPRRLGAVLSEHARAPVPWTRASESRRSASCRFGASCAGSSTWSSSTTAASGSSTTSRIIWATLRTTTLLEHLVSAMAHHQYFLQYHLYSVALHRYLAARLPDYDFERHFGGVYYLFLRGMAPAHRASPGRVLRSPQPAAGRGALRCARAGGRP